MEETRKVRIIFTSDVHGNYFPFDFRHTRWGKGSLQRVYAFVAQECQRQPGSTILIDGGDMLQGEPTSYYFNFISNSKRHRVADFCNFIGYDVAVIGNHDLETGHEVFDRYVRDCNFPVLGANAIENSTGEPYFQPYTMLYRSGVRIAVIGFITPAIPHWIPSTVWHDMHFEDITESARKWVARVKDDEHPDFIIGLLHSGLCEGITTDEYKENATMDTAQNVEGFDLILYGHDHASNIEEVTTPSGRKIQCINPGSYAHNVAEVNIEFSLGANQHVISHKLESKIHYIGTVRNPHSQTFRHHFFRDYQDVSRYAAEHLGHLHSDLRVADAYFGPSAYIDLIQHLQLKVSGADISFAAPLFFNALIKAGDIKISDLFNIYRFEDKLYILKLTGNEIKRYLEMSYDGWINQMSSDVDQFLQTCPMKSNPERIGFKNFIFNFDSAAGICYEVDVRRQADQRINIISMANGTPFDPQHYYTCAMTAYRANGGGELLTKGAGIPKEELEQRILLITTHDIRYYLMEYVREEKNIYPEPMNHWKFVPEQWISKAKEREMAVLFQAGDAEAEDEANDR
mgnify:CR=1 FL=1